MKRCSIIITLLGMALFSVAGCTPDNQIELNVSAAASLGDALGEINNLYREQRPEVKIITNFASSGTIEKQIENGAPVDVFISAGESQMDALDKKGLILAETNKTLLKNTAVLVVPADSKLEIKSFADLANDNVKRIVIGDPKFVPAGVYAQKIFDRFVIASAVLPKLILANDVRQVLSYVESGNVDAGIVYLTDANSSSKVRIVAKAPDDINADIRYPVAVIRTSKNQAAARDYEDFLFTPEARAIFEKYGFTMAGK